MDGDEDGDGGAGGDEDVDVDVDAAMDLLRNMTLGLGGSMDGDDVGRGDLIDGNDDALKSGGNKDGTNKSNMLTTDKPATTTANDNDTTTTTELTLACLTNDGQVLLFSALKLFSPSPTHQPPPSPSSPPSPSFIDTD